MKQASRLDGTPAGVLKNDSAILFLHVLFNICFDEDVIPSDWGKGIINPIPNQVPLTLGTLFPTVVSCWQLPCISYSLQS